MPSEEAVGMRIVVNMVVTIVAALNFLSSLSSLIGQPSLGCLRLIFSVFFTYVVTRCDAIADSGRLGFICRPETNEFHREQCFSRYSAEMSPLMRPYLFLLVTACMLVCLWTTMIVYSLRHLAKIRRETFSSKKEHLCHQFWKKFLLHVSSEAVVLSVILGLFCYTQKIYFPETYNCTLRNALVTCTYLHQWNKSLLNIVLIGVMALMLLFCLATFYQAMCNRENFIKELLTLNTTQNEADDGANHHRSTQFNGSSSFSNTGNSNEQQVASVKHKVWNIDAAQVPDDVCQDLANDVSLDWKKLGRCLGISKAHLENIAHENHCVCEQSIALLNEWRERAGEEATIGVLRKALKKIEKKDLSDKVQVKFHSKGRLLSTLGGIAAWNTETGYADSSWQSRFDTSPNLTGTASSASASASSSVSPSLSNSIRHRKRGDDSDDSGIE